jgi:hypothetical protein
MRSLRLFLAITCAALMCAGASAQQGGQASGQVPAQSHEQAAEQKPRAAEKDAKVGREEKDAGAGRPDRTQAEPKGETKARAKTSLNLGQTAKRLRRAAAGKNSSANAPAKTATATGPLPASSVKPRGASEKIGVRRNTTQAPTPSSALGGRQFVNARNRNANVALGGASESSARSGGGISGTKIRRKP